MRAPKSSWNHKAWMIFIKSKLFLPFLIQKFCGTFFFEENTVTQVSYLETLQTWFFHSFMRTLMILYSNRMEPQHIGTTIPHWLTVSMLGRAHRTPKHCPTLLASKISRYDPVCLLLVGICEVTCFSSNISLLLNQT